MNTFVQHLNAPEYMHVLLNPVPVYGLAFGTFALVFALLLRNHRVTIAALVLVFVGAISAWPVYHYGEAGYDRVKAMSDPGGERWLDEHMVRGEKLIWTFYVLAAKGHQLRDVSKVKTWLFTTLHREFLESRRHQSRFPHFELAQVDAELLLEVVDRRLVDPGLSCQPALPDLQ